MPRVHEMLESKFLKKEDVGRGMLVTIAGVEQRNVAVHDAEPEMKWAIAFHETEKPMVLNSTNIQLIAKVTGSDDTDHWVGHKIVLYEDHNVSFGGKLVGGIRVRAPRPDAIAKHQASQPAPPEPVWSEANGASDDDIPF